MTEQELDAELKAAIRGVLERGARIEDVRILWNGYEWRWSSALKKWDIYDPAALAVYLGEDE